MLDIILTDQKKFRIFCLVLLAILFFIVLRKDKKEKFGTVDQDSLKAINDFSKLTKTMVTNGKLNINTLTVDNKDMSAWVTDQKAKINTDFKTKHNNLVDIVKSILEKMTFPWNKAACNNRYGKNDCQEKSDEGFVYWECTKPTPNPFKNKSFLCQVKNNYGGSFTPAQLTLPWQYQSDFLDKNGNVIDINNYKIT